MIESEKFYSDEDSIWNSAMSVTGEVEFLYPNLGFRLEKNREDKTLVTVFENMITLVTIGLPVWLLVAGAQGIL